MIVTHFCFLKLIKVLFNWTGTTGDIDIPETEMHVDRYLPLQLSVYFFDLLWLNYLPN